MIINGTFTINNNKVYFNEVDISKGFTLSTTYKLIEHKIKYILLDQISETLRDNTIIKHLIDEFIVTIDNIELTNDDDFIFKLTGEIYLQHKSNKDFKLWFKDFSKNFELYD